MTVAAGLALALASAVALNWGWSEQHRAASAAPRLSLRRPLRSFSALVRSGRWLAGFFVGLGGWAAYIAALTLAPLSLVQATSAGGICVLALLAQHNGAVQLRRGDWVAVAVAAGGLALLGLSLAGGVAGGNRAAVAALAVWIAASAIGAAVAAGPATPVLAGGAGLGIAAGILYATGDVATKVAVAGITPLAFVPVVLAAHGLAFVCLQLGFQRGAPLATAGVASLLTNALPIAAGVALFHETLPDGGLGVVRVAAFGCVVCGAALLARRDSPATRVVDRPA
jgi:hypothetical protein